MTDFNKILPNWSLKIDEISNNVYQFTAISENGSKAEFTDSDYENGLKRIQNEAFDLELQINKEVNKFIFDTFLNLLSEDLIKDKKYEHEFFGSWIIQMKSKRIILDGKESILSLEKKGGFLITNWTEQQTIQIREGLRYEDIEMIINKI